MTKEDEVEMEEETSEGEADDKEEDINKNKGNEGSDMHSESDEIESVTDRVPPQHQCRNVQAMEKKMRARGWQISYQA